MMRYGIRKLTEEMPGICGKEFNPEDSVFCKNVPFTPIGSYVWDAEGYKPEARAYVTWSEKGLHVLMCALEEEIRAAVTEFNGPVCTDSCLEFFLQPFADDPRYVNFEVNAGGTALIGIGADRYDRVCLEKMPEDMDVTVSCHCGGWWAVSYIVPFALLKELYGRVPESGDVMRGNFYKCDESIHPHFGSWSPVRHFKPDFHRPECFGELALEA